MTDNQLLAQTLTHTHMHTNVQNIQYAEFYAFPVVEWNDIIYEFMCDLLANAIQNRFA